MTAFRFGPGPNEDPLEWAHGQYLHLRLEGFPSVAAGDAEAFLTAWADGSDPEGDRRADEVLRAHLHRYCGGGLS